MRHHQSRRYCPNGHCIEDEQLNYCPECGAPLTNPSDSNDYSSNNNTIIKHEQPTSSGDYRQNAPLKKRKIPAGYIVLITIILSLVFVILEMADITNLIPPLHRAGSTAGESSSPDIQMTGNTDASTPEPTNTPMPNMEAQTQGKKETALSSFQYITENNQVTITAYTGTDKDVVIPSHINDNPVTAIGDSAFGNGTAEHIESVVLPETITRIDDYAFHACYSLREVNLPEGIVSLGINAFGFCPIETITLPKSLQQMGDGVFWRNSALNKITIQNDETEYQGNPFSGCDSLALAGIILPDNNSKIYKKGNALFTDQILLFVPENPGITSYSVPEGTEKIANGAFEGLTELRELWIPDSVRAIGENAFLSCSSLDTIHFGKGLENIEFCAFIYCYSLTEVELPDGLVSIGSSAFYYCTQLSKITIPSSVHTIEDGAFDETNNITIYGEKGSAAEQYANKHSHKFVVKTNDNDGKQKSSSAIQSR